ncbi:MAG: gfo/Idh/MocA family oxidoreductase, partial [Bacteroidota bacterium]
IANFVDCCINGGTTSSDFARSGPLTETVLMGNLAVKAYQYKVLQEGKQIGDWAPYDYPGRRKLLWDGENMKITNYDKANEWVTREYRPGWELG